MDGVADERVNWSAVASQAFESKLAEIIARKGAKDMKDVVNRLKASKAKTSNVVKAKAREIGETWAKNYAEAAELQRLEELCQGDWEEWLAGPFNNAYGISECFVFALQPENDGDRDAVSTFWEGLVNDFAKEAEDPDFIDGFAEGALEVWDAVKDQV